MRRVGPFRGAALLVVLSLVATACAAAPATPAPATPAPATPTAAPPATPTAPPAATATAAPATATAAPATDTPAPSTPEPTATATAEPTPPAVLPFAGINVNLLTFNGPQVAEPLQRRAPDFERLTGAHVNVIAVGFQEIYNKALGDAATGTNAFDAYVFNPQWMGDFVGPGYLLDITDRVNADSALDWQDVGPFFRDFNATYDSKVYTIPLDGDFHMVYYRSDLIPTPPRTWDEYLAAANSLQGKDHNGDGEPDYGSCIAKKKGAQSYWWIISMAGGLLQAKGTGEGAFFNTTDMAPLFGDNEAMAKALAMYNETTKAGPPDELNLDVGATRGLFTTGRCALTIDWGDIGTLTPGTYSQDKTGAVITPGWTETLDRATGKLVPCDATVCPHAIDGVNYAPFASFGGWSGAINTYVTSKETDPVALETRAKVQDAAFAFLSYMSSPAISGEDVTLGKTGYNPYRTSHFENNAPWIAAGLSDQATTQYLDAIKNSLNSPNMILDLRIPLTKQYEQDVLDIALAQYLAGELDAAATGQQITDGWNAITDEVGRDQQLASYVASLGVQR